MVNPVEVVEVGEEVVEAAPKVPGLLAKAGSALKALPGKAWDGIKNAWEWIGPKPRTATKIAAGVVGVGLAGNIPGVAQATVGTAEGAKHGVGYVAEKTGEGYGRYTNVYNAAEANNLQNQNNGQSGASTDSSSSGQDWKSTIKQNEGLAPWILGVIGAVLGSMTGNLWFGLIGALLGGVVAKPIVEAITTPAQPAASPPSAPAASSTTQATTQMELTPPTGIPLKPLQPGRPTQSTPSV